MSGSWVVALVLHQDSGNKQFLRDRSRVIIENVPIYWHLQIRQSRNNFKRLAKSPVAQCCLLSRLVSRSFSCEEKDLAFSCAFRNCEHFISAFWQSENERKRTRTWGEPFRQVARPADLTSVTNKFIQNRYRHA